MRKILLFCVVSIGFLSFLNVANAQPCDKAEAESVIKEIQENGLASREDARITIFYHWNAGWFGMNEGQQFSMASGLGGAERCLREGVTVRIRSAGRDVARSTGRKTEIY